jgi:hypothetical protein
MVSMDTETESCKHLENQTIPWELTHGFRDNAFMKNSNGTLGGSDVYPGCVIVIIGSTSVNLRDSDSNRSQRFFIEIRQADVV